MAEATEDPTSAPTWVLDLTTVALTALGRMPDSNLADARDALLDRIGRPFATVAGSEGS